jgi:hypothetical protein
VLDWCPVSYFDPGPKGKPNKWTTLYVYLALKHRMERLGSDHQPKGASHEQSGSQ